MEPNETPTIVKLRAHFQNREAIYIEHGALRVRIGEIRCLLSRQRVSASVEEIPTPGLGVGAFDQPRFKGKTPYCWSIGAGYLSEFTEHRWVMGYGAWSVYVDPKVVNGVVELAAHFPDDMDTLKRYGTILGFLEEQSPHNKADWQLVFPSD